MRVKEVKKEVGRIVKAVKEMSAKVLVVTSIQENKFAELVLPEFDKRIDLNQEKHGRLTAQLYNHGDRRSISLTERELEIIPKS